jgi:hypothetical protein
LKVSRWKPGRLRSGPRGEVVWRNLNPWEVTIRSFDTFEKLEQWVTRLRTDLPLGRAIDIVSDRMRNADNEDQYYLAFHLKDLLMQAERCSEVPPILDEMIERFPDDVRFPISKATLNLYFLKDPEEALRCIDLALERAYRTGFFRREALGDKARILLQLGRGEQLSEVLEEIMSLQMMRDIPDIGRERDFVDRAPPGLIREDVLARYNEFRPKRAEDSGSDEPPELE